LVRGTKAIVTSWWVMQTRMNPNWKEVVQRRLALHLYEKKQTQYLMETQVFYISSSLFLTSLF
jgi:hypothetical protein